MIEFIIHSLIITGGLGLVFGLGLALFSQKFKVEEDPRLELIQNLLPGANCGACGYPGCRQLAEAILRGELVPEKCTVGGNKVVAEIGNLLGIEVSQVKPGIACIICQGDEARASRRAEYYGINTCNAASQISGGFKQCFYGCLGLADCVKVCPFDALRMSLDNLPLVDESKCTACGLCVKACPRKIIDIFPRDNPVIISCVSPQKGPEVRKACQVGCIKCGICVKNCPQGAIHLEPSLGNLAVIDYTLCNNCGVCVEKCPTKCIVNYTTVHVHAG
ncbi:MAG: Electron transport complex subunit RsxB [candidate division WS2 bacterium]|uniref:Ion-translocating oxidoreductase complex subunit B n=1 Tax=Psychracetigena formicireducens TaxID=2986056 RepID=A0A9E2BF00_PSYF1|nr:Electron transport complex subunit RsxB [Candidatus Psychracetigena formicireducens]MBT9144287.1 Electron transport complex subunit RsxB [Candidatus Psychracetigena formicireducens]MBT9149931.1 Electron transport complex subunit RsxB [Candidatus Psychracetigena formicireducens]